jgi:protein-disulfide isomerase
MASTASRVRAPQQRRSGQASRRRLYLVAFAAGALLALAAIGASLLSGSGGKSAGTAGPLVGAGATTQLLAGIPQHGTTLGSPAAPYRLVEYADLQCPYCGIWAREVLPAIIRIYVRPGNLQIEFRGLTFIGPDSRAALETALGAASQNRFWNVADLLYRNQGTENTGWVTDSLLRKIVRAVPGLAAPRALAARSSAAVAAGVDTSARLAALDGVASTPTFELGLRLGALRPLQFSALDVPSFTTALNAAMRG